LLSIHRILLLPRHRKSTGECPTKDAAAQANE
jgi:hypothetical protein